MGARLHRVCLALLLLLLAACSPEPTADELLQGRIEAAIDQASDLRLEGLILSTDQGVVTVSGALQCEDCGGMRTPGGIGVVQQSLGAVIRAVPGVEQVVFDLQY